jgi:hypothetical protein
LSKLKAWKVPLKLVLRLPSRVLIQRNCGMPDVNYIGGRVDSCELLPI